MLSIFYNILYIIEPLVSFEQFALCYISGKLSKVIVKINPLLLNSWITILRSYTVSLTDKVLAILLCIKL
jgi:hypothetical protein